MTIKITIPTENIIKANISKGNKIRISNDYLYNKAYILTGKTTTKDELTTIKTENILHKTFKASTKYLAGVYLPTYIKNTTAYVLPNLELQLNLKDYQLPTKLVKQKHGHGKGSGKIKLSKEYHNKTVQLIFYEYKTTRIDEIIQTKADDEGNIIINGNYVGRTCYLLDHDI